MAALLKDIFSNAFITELGERFSQQGKNLNAQSFVQFVLQPPWPELSLTQRAAKISQAFYQQLQTLPLSDQILILQQTVSHYPKAKHGSLTLLPFTHFVSEYGLAEPDQSLPALAFFTEYASAEFAIRFFIKTHETQTLKTINQWAHHKSVHVRRLASEGSRPLLPWGQVLHTLKAQPEIILPVLEILANDSEPYVRKSVANHLNDISKNHPKTALAFAKKIQAQPHGQAVIKHGLRTLLKQGHPEALALIGITPATHITLGNFACDTQINIGDKLNVSFELTSAEALGQLRLEYAIGFLRSNGQHNFKRFHLSSKHCPDNFLRVSKQHDFKKLTSRRYYPGKQTLQIFLNGQLLQEASFKLL